MARTEDAWIGMRDGVRLAATLYLPPEDNPERPEPRAALLEALPYRKDDLTAHYRPEYHRFADEFGYVVCRLDIRGTGSSEGIALDEYHSQELTDICEVIDYPSVLSTTDRQSVEAYLTAKWVNGGAVPAPTVVITANPNATVTPATVAAIAAVPARTILDPRRRVGTTCAVLRPGSR
jgi:hypothetical protein